jgi:NADH-quinone oxidoreductase subunit H
VAPMTIFIAAIVVFAVIPFGSVIPPDVFPASWGIKDNIRLVAAPGVDVGMIYVFAVGSIAVYGVVLGGWASNNKYSFLGGLRSGAQLISYELPLGLGIIGVVLVTGSLRLDTIISHQAQTGVWNVITQPLGFLVFCVAAFAEAARLPFDLPEAEQELVGGYHTEYSGIKLMMYMVAEFLHMITAAFLIVILFLGGWHFWGLTGSSNEITWPVAILRVIVLLAKVMGAILFFMIARWSWPRFRYDQLMDLGWKVMIPWGVVNLVVVAVWMEYGDHLARLMALSTERSMAVVGWGALLLTWLVTVVADPTSGDNRPRREAPL